MPTRTQTKKNVPLRRQKRFQTKSLKLPLFLAIFSLITSAFSVYQLVFNTPQGFQYLSRAFGGGVTYYVSTAGSDTNTGSESSPLKTFAKAISLAAPGDTVVARAGQYKEKVSVTQSGTADQPITIKSAPGELAVLDLANTTSPIIQVSGSYVVVDGFEVRNSNGYCVSLLGKYITAQNLNVHNCSGHGIYTDGQYITIQNNTVSLASMSYVNTTAASGWGSGIKVRVNGDHITIKGNTVFNNWGEGIAVTRGTNAVVTENKAYDNFSVNFYIDNSYDVEVSKNFAYCTPLSGFERNGQSAPGIALGEEYYDGWGSQLARVNIVNNVVNGCSRGLITYAAMQAGGGLDTINILNNTFWNTTLTSMSFGFNGTPVKNRNTVIANNIVNQSAGKVLWADTTIGMSFTNNNWSVKPALGSSTTDVIGNPLFAIAPLLNDPLSFRLGNSSTVVNKGKTFSQEETDYENKLRNSPDSPAYDIGAFEFAGDMSPASPLPSPSVAPSLVPTPSPVASPVPSLSPVPTPSPVASPVVTPSPVASPMPSPSATLDTVAPSVIITSPVSYQVVPKGTFVAINVTSTDNVKVTKLEVRVNGALMCSTTTSAFSCRWKVGKSAGVTYTIEAKAYDAAGNVGKTTNVVTSN